MSHRQKLNLVLHFCTLHDRVKINAPSHRELYSDDEGKVCLTCGKDFAPEAHNSVYCSVHCRTYSPKNLKTCPFCKKQFFSAQKNQKACSTACSNRGRADKQCPVCKKSFKPKNHTQKFCGLSCSNYSKQKWVKL